MLRLNLIDSNKLQEFIDYVIKLFTTTNQVHVFIIFAIAEDLLTLSVGT